MPSQSIEASRLAARPVHEILEHTAGKIPGRPAIGFMGRRWRYGELGDLVNRATRGLQDLGVSPGMKVGLCLPNTPYSLIFYYAILKAGGTVVNFNPLYVERELLHQIRDSQTRIMVVIDVPMVFEKVASVADAGGLSHVIVCPLADALPSMKGLAYRLLKRRDQAKIPKDPRFIPYRRIAASQGRPDSVAIDPNTAIAVLQYTGGTTGVPKGAMLTHANLFVNCEQIVLHLDDVVFGRERVLGVLPLFHVFAMTCVMNYSIRMGAEIVLMPRFDAEQTLDTIEKLRPSMMAGVPTLFAALSNAAANRPRDLSSLRSCMSGGAPLPREVGQRFEEISGCVLFEGYGLSETSPVVTINPVKAVRVESSGVALPGTMIEIRDTNDSSKVLGTGEKGEICVRGPQVMAGYWNRAEDTRNVMIDGALRTGDIGYLDSDGYLFIVDRLKDLIICSGYNVYPHVIETALYQHRDVLEAVVIGVPDDYRGQAPKAFVTLRPGASSTGEELKRFIADYVSKIEMPKSVEIRAALPKTAVGKLSRKELVAEELASLLVTAAGRKGAA